MRPMLLALALVPLAAAGDAGDYSRLFPVHPCSDGWAGCVVDGDVHDADASRDGAGYPMPSDLRFGWFDLGDTASTSPFTGLSDYSELPPPVVAARTPEPRSAPTPTPAERRDVGANPTGATPTPEVVTQRSSGTTTSTSRSYEPPAERSTPSRKASSGTTTTSSGSSSSSATTSYGSGSSSSSSSGSVMSYASDSSSSSGSSTPSSFDDAPTELEAAPPPIQDPFAIQESGSTFAQQEEVASSSGPIDANPLSSDMDGSAMANVDPGLSEVAEAISQPEVYDDSCDDLSPLKPQASMGKLRDGQIGCLEEAFSAAGSQTAKDDISRVLMINADAKGDKRAWEKIVKRHLDEVGRSDPEICFAYALHLSKGSVGRAHGVIKWADYALENKTRWTGSTYKARVYALYKLKAEAATRLWEDAAQKVVEGKGDRDALQAEEEKRRGIAKTYALEWLTYARQSGQKTSEPMALCVSAAGNKKFCGE